MAVPVAQAPDLARLWASLARLEAYKREVWAELQAGVREAVRDEWYLLLRRLLHTELTLLEQLYAEPEAAVLGDGNEVGEEEDDDG